MKELKKEFVKNKFNHKQVLREGDLAIYERWKDGDPKHWEVIKIQSHNGFYIGEKYIEPSETYPGSSQWGNLGWTIESLERAIKKIEELKEKEKKRNDNQDSRRD